LALNVAMDEISSIGAVAVAAVLCALWAGIHIVLGGREIEAPLRRDRHHPDSVRGPAVMVWHMMSVALVFLAGIFALGGILEQVALIWAGTVLATAFAIVGLMVPLRLGIPFRVMPQGWLFVPVAALGLFAVL